MDIESELAVAADLVANAQRQAIGRVDSSAESVASLLTNRRQCDPSTGSPGAGGTPVGLLAVECDRRHVRCSSTRSPRWTRRRRWPGWWTPAWRRRGGSLGATAPRRRAGVDPYTVSADFWQVMAGHHPEDEAYGRVLTDRGLRPIRRFWRMGLDLAGRPTNEPKAPEGVQLRRAEDEADRRIVHDIDRTAFADHFGIWESGSFEEWLDDIASRPGHDPDRSADRGNSTALRWGSACSTRPCRNLGEDHVRRLGVLPAARGRGIGRWLLELAASQAAEEGCSALTLSVDGENASGAMRLYESIGFTARHVVDAWCRPLYSIDARAEAAGRCHPRRMCPPCGLQGRCRPAA